MQNVQTESALVLTKMLIQFAHFAFIQFFKKMFFKTLFDNVNKDHFVN